MTTKGRKSTDKKLTLGDLIPYAAMDVLAVSCGRKRQFRGIDARGIEQWSYFRGGSDMSGGPISDQLLQDGIAGTLDITLSMVVAKARFSGKAPDCAEAFRVIWHRCLEGRDAQLFMLTGEARPYGEGKHPDIQDLVEQGIWDRDLLLAGGLIAMIMQAHDKEGVELAVDMLNYRVGLVDAFVLSHRHRIIGEAAQMLKKARENASKNT